MPKKSKADIIDGAKQEYNELVASNRHPGIDMNSFVEGRLREKQPELAYSNRLSSLHSQKVYHKKKGRSTAYLERQIKQLKSNRTSFIAQYRADMTTNGSIPPVQVAAAPFVSHPSNLAPTGTSSGFPIAAHADFYNFVSKKASTSTMTADLTRLVDVASAPTAAHPLPPIVRTSTSRLDVFF